MKDRVCAALLFALAMVPSAGAAQRAILQPSEHGFVFGDASVAGLRWYSLTTTTLGVSYPVRSGVEAGAAIRYGYATMGTSGSGGASHSGVADADLFGVFRAGPLRVRGTLVLDVGSTTTSSEANVVAALASYELLPFPMRSWGRGGGYGLEVAYPLRRLGFDVEIVAATQSHGAFQPFEDDGFEYRMGAERRLGVAIGRTLTSSSRLEVTAGVVRAESDRVLQRDVFEPGSRWEVSSLAVFPVRGTSLLLRGTYYGRAAGVDLSEPGVGDHPMQTLVGGTVSPDARELVIAHVETRTETARLPLVTTLRYRGLRGGEGAWSGWLVGAGVGTEADIQPPLRGRFTLVPMLAGYGGQTRPRGGPATSAWGWEVSAALRWEAPR